MPLNVPIPNGIFGVGSTVYGPGALAAGDTWLAVTLDRTVNQGLNARTAATTVQTVFEMALPADPATPADVVPGQWYEIGRTTFEGGQRVDSETGVVLATDVYEVALFAPGLAGRQVRLTVTVAGSSVRLAGSLTVT